MAITQMSAAATQARNPASQLIRLFSFALTRVLQLCLRILGSLPLWPLPGARETALSVQPSADARARSLAPRLVRLAALERQHAEARGDARAARSWARFESMVAGEGGRGQDGAGGGGDAGSGSLACGYGAGEEGVDGKRALAVLLLPPCDAGRVPQPGWGAVCGAQRGGAADVEVRRGVQRGGVVLLCGLPAGGLGGGAQGGV